MKLAMPNRKILLIGAGVVALLIVVAAVVMLWPRKAAQSQSQPLLSAEIQPTPELQAQPSQTATVIQAPTQNPDDFTGDWYFIKFDGKETTGLLKGHDIGLFKNTVNGNMIHADCAAPLSPSPKGEDKAAGYPGDVFRWDSTTNKLYPLVDNAQGNIQRFWFPRYISQ